MPRPIWRGTALREAASPGNMVAARPGVEVGR